jgi:hypothetical protein
MLSPEPYRSYRYGGIVSNPPKIKRDAFLYFDGKPPRNMFAQCGTCVMFTDGGCLIHDKKYKVTKDMTCCLYVHGEPAPDLRGQEQPCVTPKESGLANLTVRCENCEYGGTHCGLFMMLNDQLPDTFELDTKIDSKGCCNAWTPKRKS